MLMEELEICNNSGSPCRMYVMLVSVSTTKSQFAEVDMTQPYSASCCILVVQTAMCILSSESQSDWQFEVRVGAPLTP